MKKLCVFIFLMLATICGTNATMYEMYEPLLWFGSSYNFDNLKQSDGMVIAEESYNPKYMFYIYGEGGTRHYMLCYPQNTQESDIPEYQIYDNAYSFTYQTYDPYEKNTVFVNYMNYSGGYNPQDYGQYLNNDYGTFRDWKFIICGPNGWIYNDFVSLTYWNSNVSDYFDHIISDEVKRTPLDMKLMAGFVLDIDDNFNIKVLGSRNCSPGTYGPTNGGLAGCTACPYPNDVFTNSALTIKARGTTGWGAKSQSDCHLASGKYYNQSGEFTLLQTCPY